VGQEECDVGMIGRIGDMRTEEEKKKVKGRAVVKLQALSL